MRDEKGDEQQRVWNTALNFSRPSIRRQGRRCDVDRESHKIDVENIRRDASRDHSPASFANGMADAVMPVCTCMLARKKSGWLQAGAPGIASAAYCNNGTTRDEIRRFCCALLFPALVVKESR